MINKIRRRLEGSGKDRKLQKNYPAFLRIFRGIVFNKIPGQSNTQLGDDHKTGLSLSANYYYLCTTFIF
jgi:hypothetical protein